MLEALVAAFVLGLTAGLCPICLLFASPILPYAVSKCRNNWGAFRTTIEFSAGIAAIFSPLGAIAPWAVNLLSGGKSPLPFLVAGVISIVMGLLVLRAFKIPYWKFCRTPNVRLLGSGAFAYGFSYGLTTIGRGAPLLFSILTIVSVAGNMLLGATALAIYAFCMGAPLIALTVVLGLAGLEKHVLKYSRKLDTVSGILLLSIGAYYLWSSLLIKH